MHTFEARELIFRRIEHVRELLYKTADHLLLHFGDSHSFVDAVDPAILFLNLGELTLPEVGVFLKPIFFGLHFDDVVFLRLKLFL